jgi:hypothetical protein
MCSPPTTAEPIGSGVTSSRASAAASASIGFYLEQVARMILRTHRPVVRRPVGVGMSSVFGARGCGSGSTGPTGHRKRPPGPSQGLRRNAMNATSTGNSKVVVNRCLSLDGFIAAAGHVLDWGDGRQLTDFAGPDEFHEIAAATGAMLVGRRTADVATGWRPRRRAASTIPFPDRPHPLARGATGRGHHLPHR